MTISDKVKKILHSLPPGVELEAAAKGRPGEAVQEAIAAGICIIGENYLQEAEKHYQSIGNGISWHFIGHLQKNKVKKAIALFDMIETIDSLSLAEEINNKCRTINKVMPVLIEINSGHEPQKHGVFLEDAPSLVYDISGLSHIRVTGLMTMGPVVTEPEKLRPYFIETKVLFDKLKKLEIPGIQMKYLSMGMSDSYPVAVEEGANLVRIGSKIFA